MRSGAALIRRLRRAFYLLVGRVATAPLVAPLHRRLYGALGGRFLGTILGWRIVLLTTTGRRSGKPRTTPLIGVADGERILVVASNAAKDRAPDWYRNLSAEPRVVVQIGADRRAMRARDATGADADALWERAIRAYPGYAVYREVARRTIPLVILEPDSAARPRAS